MKKGITIAALAALSLGWSQVSHAQTATTASQATGIAGAGAIAGGGVGIGTLNVGGAGGGGSQPGYANINTTGTIWTLGGTPSMNTTQYDACTKYISASAILGGVSVPLEIGVCWDMRIADSIAKYPPGSVQYNLLCNDSGVLRNDWDTGTMACTNNKAKLRKSSPNDPRGIATTAVPVVAVGGYGVGQNLQPVPNAPPPTVVPVPVTPVNRAQVPADRTSPPMQTAALDNVPAAELCFGGNGQPNGRVVNGACQ